MTTIELTLELKHIGMLIFTLCSAVYFSSSSYKVRQVQSLSSLFHYCMYLSLIIICFTETTLKYSLRTYSIIIPLYSFSYRNYVCIGHFKTISYVETGQLILLSMCLFIGLKIYNTYHDHEQPYMDICLQMTNKD